MNFNINGQNLLSIIKAVLQWVSIAVISVALARIIGWQVPLIYGSEMELIALAAALAFISK